MKVWLLLSFLSLSMVSESFAFTCSASDESGRPISIVVDQKNVTIK